MVKKIIYTALVFIMILTTLILVACNNNDGGEWKDIPFNVGYVQNETDGNFLRNVKSISEKVDSRDDLIDICKDFSFPFFNQNHSLYNHPLSQKIRSYDKSYFKDNELILLFIHEPVVNPANINSLKINGETLKIEIDKNNSLADVMTVLSVWLFVIEVSEDDVDDIDKIVTSEILPSTVK